MVYAQTSKQRKTELTRFIAIALILLWPIIANTADERLELSKTVVESFKHVSSRWAILAQQHAEIGQHLQNLNLKDSADAVNFLEKSEIGKVLAHELEGSSFSSISEILNFSKRFLGIKYYIEIKTGESGVNLVDMVAILQANIDRLAESGASEKTIRKMTAQLAHHKQRADTIQYMLSLLDDKDKSYVDENLDWFKNMMAAEPTND